MNKLECFVNDAEVDSYMDHELPPDRESLLDKHLGRCFDCAARYQVARELKELVRRACGGAVAPILLRDRITSGIEEARTARRGFWDFARDFLIVRPLLPIGAAAALVVILLSVALIRSTGPGAMNLVDAMVHEHDEYVNGFETDRGIQSADPQVVRQWIADNSGTEINLPRESWFLSLVGACKIREHGHEVTCLFFDKGEKRVSLFVLQDGITGRPSGKSTMVKDKSVFSGRSTGNNYVYWLEGNCIRILVSKLPEESLIRMAGDLI
jgi:mycothiol system anti-sigma-R factor